MPFKSQEKLTFGLIADAWSREIADDEIKRSDILHRLLQALWLGEFEVNGKSLLGIIIPGCALEPGKVINEDGKISDLGNATPITRSGLIRVIELKGLMPAIPEANNNDTFTNLAKLPAENFGELVKNAYLEALIVSRDDFACWCDKHDFERPSFWFTIKG